MKKIKTKIFCTIILLTLGFVLILYWFSVPQRHSVNIITFKQIIADFESSCSLDLQEIKSHQFDVNRYSFLEKINIYSKNIKDKVKDSFQIDYFNTQYIFLDKNGERLLMSITGINDNICYVDINSSQNNVLITPRCIEQFRKNLNKGPIIIFKK